MSLSSSSQLVPNDASGGGYEGYENTLIDRGYQKEGLKQERGDDAYEGYVLVNDLENSAGLYSSDEEEEDDAGGSSSIRASRDVLAVGSGALTTIREVAAREESRVAWTQQFQAVLTRLPDETAEEQLERVLELRASSSDESARKFSLALQIVDGRIDQWSRGPLGPPAGGGDTLTKLCRMQLEASRRIKEQPLQNASFLNTLHTRLYSEEGLLAARHILDARLRAANRTEWNDRFQRILDLAETSPDEKLFKYQSLQNVAQDFRYSAELVARLIVNELSLPDPLKTVKPAAQFGGHAGGTKYVCNATLFKLAVDDHGLYGGTANAQKAAGHELKSLAAYFDCRLPGLHCPLTCLIDYRGYRILAAALVPIRQSTLVYGSDDGGRTVHDDSPQLSRLMREAAQLLNLAGHAAGVRQQKFLYACCDIEGHLGADGRMYVVDFARAFPPQTPRMRDAASSPQMPRYKGGHLYRLLRPELVARFEGGALSSDAFSGFGQNNVHADRLVRQATTHLLNSAIPTFAESMDQSPLLAHPRLLLAQLSNLLHRSGINVRFLGRVRRASSAASFRSILMVEMMARTVKHHIWAGFRTLQSLQALPSEEPHRALLIDNLNLLLDSGPDGANYWWKVKSDLQNYFGRQSLEIWEASSNYDLRRHCKFSVLIERVCALTGICLTSDAVEALEADQLGSFVGADIERIDARVKSMNVVEISSAIALSMQAAAGARAQERERLFTLCYRKFEAAANASPSNMTTRRYWALALLSHARLLGGGNRSCILLDEADRLLDESVALDSELRSQIVRLLAQMTTEPQQAAALFVRALKLGDQAGAELTVEQAKEYALSISETPVAYALLSRLQLALGECEEASPWDGWKRLHNGVGVMMMDMADVGLDLESVERMGKRLLSDKDTTALIHLLSSSEAKYAAFRAPGLEDPTRLLQLTRDSLEILPDSPEFERIRARLAVFASANNPFHANVFFKEAKEAILKTSLSDADRLSHVLLESLDAFIMFVEDSMGARSSIPCARLDPPHAFGAHRLWDPASEEWKSFHELSTILLERRAMLAQLSALLLSTNDECNSLSFPMAHLASLIQVGKCSPKLQVALGSSITSLTLVSAFGLEESGSRAVAANCPGLQELCVHAGGEALILACVCPSLKRLILDQCSGVALANVLSSAMEIASSSLEFLSLPEYSGRVFSPMKALRELHVRCKLHPDLLLDLLAESPLLSKWVIRRKETVKVVLLRSAVGNGDPLHGWGLAINGQLKSTPLARNVGKVFYRGWLARNPNGLALVAAAIFNGPGGLNGSAITLLRKLGHPLLQHCIDHYIETRKFEELYAVLRSCDRLDRYDSSSVLGGFVQAIRSALFNAAHSFFGRYLQDVGQERTAEVLGSLDPLLVAQLSSMQNADDGQALFECLLKLSSQNPQTIMALKTLFGSLQHNVLGITERLNSQLEQLQSEDAGPVECNLLMLALMEGEASSLAWASVSRVRARQTLGLWDYKLAQSFLSQLGAGLTCLSLRYGLQVREPLMWVTDDFLAMVSARFPGLECAEFDLAPSVTNEGVKALVTQCTRIRTLQIRAPLVTDAGIDSIVKSLSSILTHLTLQCAVRDIMLSKMGSQMTALTHMDFFECPIVTVHGLERAVNNSSSLYSLRHEDCRHVRFDLVQVRNFVRKLTREGQPVGELHPVSSVGLETRTKKDN